jgi:hypothetical protein
MDLKRIYFLPVILLLKNVNILTFSEIFSIVWVDSLFVVKAGKEAFVWGTKGIYYCALLGYDHYIKKNL